MGNDISVNPDRLEDLANDLVTRLSRIEDEYRNLHMELADLINSAPPEYRHCFYHVGDPWSTGNQLTGQLSEMEIDLRMVANKFAEADNLVGKLYKLYEQYGAVTALGTLMTKQLAFYGLGFTQFAKNAEGVFTYKHMAALQKVTDKIDETKKLRTMTKAFLSPFYLRSKYKDVPLADLVHKKVAKYLPDDVVKFTESSNTLYRKTLLRTVDSTDFKSFVKTGAKFAKTNAASTVLLTGIMEAGGMGLKISENYSKYGDNPDVLKRENAKAVGNAVNKTLAISGGAIAGAAIGGALGSMVGPVGTVVGAAAGSFVGGLVGEKTAELTAGFAEKVSILLKEPIHFGVEKFKSGFEKAGKAIDVANKGIDIVNNQIKETIEDPVGKIKDIGKGLSKAKETAGSLIEGAKGFLDKKLSFF
ncbi:WXG100 family type VII secretion target [Cytobacillus oceanisediminis]|uniref:WXG100 family type VII secretion target n=1 Tax=Cytobacillus oceanisediminis TaxID=665099 RepID=UPI0024944FAE|nr:glycine zipper domain-containing protein [Cytobacillus oceanisediminis]